METLRDRARQIDWAQAHADGLAVLRKEVTLDQLPAANRDNLQRARDVLGELAANESYYRVQTLRRLDTYDDVKKAYAKYIHQRDQAALQGAVGGAGLAVIYTADAVSHVLAATGIPMAKFYNTVRGVADQSVALAREWSAARAAEPRPAANEASSAKPGLPAWASTHDVAAPSAPRATDAAAPAGNWPAPGKMPDTMPEKTVDERIRSVTEPLQVARELHKAVDETLRQDHDIAGVDRVRGWTTAKRLNETPADESIALKVSKGTGELVDTSLKLATSVADVEVARRSGDADRIFTAESQALRASLQSGAKVIELGQRGEKLAGVRGPSGEFQAPAQIMKGFKAADKVVGGAQTAISAVDAYYDARDGNYDRAWARARDGVTNAAKTFTAYGGQVEAAGKAVDALHRSLAATTARDKTTGFMEYAAYATKVATVPGASDAGDAILSAKSVVEQGFVVKDAADLHKQDLIKPNLDRLGRNIRDDYQLYMYLNQFRPMFDLPGPRQPVNLLTLDPSIPRPDPL